MSKKERGWRIKGNKAVRYLEYSQHIRFYCSHEAGLKGDLFQPEHSGAEIQSREKRVCGQACCTLEFSSSMIKEILLM